MQRSIEAYTELHCHSCFSLLDGASTPEALVQRAAQLGMDSLALTDHDAVYGAVRFDRSAREHNVCPIFGTELTLNGGHHLTLLVENEQGWANLCYLITQARHNAPKGSAELPPDALDGHTAGLIALSGCARGEIASALLAHDNACALRAAGRLRDLFGRDSLFIELQRHHLAEDEALVYRLVALARQIGVGYVATNNVHYAKRDGQRLQDALVCIRHGQTLDSAGAICRPNSEYFLKSAQQMAALFEDYPLAITNTRRIAMRCQFSLRYGLQDLPIFPTPEGLDAEGYLRTLCKEALLARFGEPSERASGLLHHELGIILRAKLANYFLVMWDIVRFAREQGIRCQGRGSAANSLVAFLLRISPINPLEHDLVFERFLSPERQDPPDIDLDIDAQRREEVLQYVYGRYGTDHAAMACTLITFRHRSARREVGKALGLPLELIQQRADQGQFGPDPHANDATKHIAQSVVWQQFDDLCQQILGLPRHLGLHNGGMVVMGPVLSQRLPTEPATMPGRTVTQWDKDGLEDAGLIKIDLLGLRMLAAIDEASTTYEQVTGEQLNLDQQPLDDPAIYEMISQPDTIGVFQVESRAQAQVLPRLQPRKFEDLIVSISLIRPGPVQGRMVNPYLRRRSGEEAVSYLHPLLRPVLAESLGIFLFQEQILKAGKSLGQLTPGQGELLRRALGKNNEAEIGRLQAAFLEGAVRNGVPAPVAAAVFEQMRAFGGYSFPKSHAAAFAIIVYRSAWLKRYAPAVFFLALLNNQPMGAWSPEVLVNDARRHGVKFRTVDIQTSQAKCTLEDGAIRLGLLYVRGLGEVGADLVVQARTDGAFRDLADFCRRVLLSRGLVENIILVGAMDGWGISRRDLLWDLGGIWADDNPLGLRFPKEEVELPPLSEADLLYAEYALSGLSVREQIMTLYRSMLRDQGVFSSQELLAQPNNATVKVSGQLVNHQAPPTAHGIHFLALEDEAGLINVVIPPNVYTEHARVLKTSPLLIVEGQVQRRGQVVNILAARILPLG